MNTNPIIFQCVQITKKTGVEICAEIADISRWSDFDGYGFLPGIDSAEYEIKTDNMIGSRILLLNSDGSKHVEEIKDWVDGKKIILKMYEFGAPLSLFASHFMEEFLFEINGNNTNIIRKIEMYPKNMVSKLFLWLISKIFKKAIVQHSKMIAGE